MATVHITGLAEWNLARSVPVKDTVTIPAESLHMAELFHHCPRSSPRGPFLSTPTTFL